MSFLSPLLNSRYSRFLLIILLLIIPLVLTWYAWDVTTKNFEDKKHAQFKTLINESSKALEYRIDSYLQALYGGKGFIEGSNNVERSEWKAYVDAIKISENYPGINGIGIIEPVKKNAVEAFIKRERKKGFAQFNIKPEGEFPANYIIKFIEPLLPNQQAVGLNIGFEENRRNAANRARDTGRASITKRILLVQDAEKTPGFLMLLPIYKPEAKLATQQQRRAAFAGWVYAPFIAKNFIDDLTDAQNDTFDLRIYDGEEINDKNLVYNSYEGVETPSKAAHQTKRTLDILQQKWTLVWSSTKEFEQMDSSKESLVILVSGIFFTVVFALFLTIINIRDAKYKDSNPGTYIIPILVFSLIILATYGLYKEIKSRENLSIINALETETKTVKKVLISQIESQLKSLKRMSQRWNNMNGTPFKQWQSDAFHYVADQTGLTTLEWVDANFNVKWVEPIVGNEAAIGLNILFNKEREDALKGAAKTERITLTPPLDLVQGYKAFIAYSPVKKKEQFDGFIVGLFDVNEVIQNSLPQSSKDFYVELRYKNETFFQSYTGPLKDHIHHNYHESSSLKLYDQIWDLHIYPKDRLVEKNDSFLSEVTLAVGGLLGFIVALMIFFAQREQLKSNLLIEKENLLAKFVKNTPAAIAMFDDKMNYIAASDRWYADYKLAEKNIIGKNHYEVFPEIMRNYPEWRGLYQKAMNGETIRRNAELFKREDGSEEWLRFELHAWSQGVNRPNGLIIFTEFITERMKMDILKNEFISTVNHELRTPLTSIQGSLGLLKMKIGKSLDTKAKRLLDISYDNCERLAHLVNDILDMEKIAAGKMEYDIERVSLSKVISNLVERHQSYAEKHKVTFDVSLPLDDLQADIDVNRFDQALTNILSNAAKFSPENSSVLIVLKAYGANKVKISVSDKGPGIPKSFKNKIFGKFAQADGSSTRKVGGTGLGLNITKSIIEAFGGEVGFTSVEGKGATFYFILPKAVKISVL